MNKTTLTNRYIGKHELRIKRTLYHVRWSTHFVEIIKVAINTVEGGIGRCLTIVLTIVVDIAVF